MTGRWKLAFLVIVASLTAGSCEPSRADIQLASIPSTIPVGLDMPCGIPFVFINCYPPAGHALVATWTIQVSTSSGIGGAGTISVVVVDEASGQPLPDQEGSVSGNLEFALAPRWSYGNVAVTLHWRWAIPTSFAPTSGDLPARLSFVVTAQMSDTMGNHVSEVLRVPETAPRVFWY